MINDNRNDTEYICGTVLSTVSNPTLSDIADESDPTILYVAGEYQYKLMHVYSYIYSYVYSYIIVCICTLGPVLSY